MHSKLVAEKNYYKWIELNELDIQNNELTWHSKLNEYKSGKLIQFITSNDQI